MKNIDVEWSDLKSFVDDRSLSIQWLDIANIYYMYAFDGLLSLSCDIRQASSPVVGTPQEVAQQIATRYKGKVERISPVVYQPDVALLIELRDQIAAAL